jgi:hypothetical protein
MQLVLAAATALVSVLPAQAQTPIAVTGGTNITIGGLLAVGVKQSTIGQGNAATARPGLASETRLDDNTSRLTVSSSSKIADGWAVIFRVESRFSADVRPGTALGTGAYAWNAVTTPATGAQTNTRTLGTASGWADGDTWGGISSPYGTITAGKSTLYYTDTIDMSYLGMAAAGEGYRIWDANGLSSFNMLSAVTKATVGAGGVVTPSAAVTYTCGNSRSQNVIKYNSPKLGPVDFTVAFTKSTGGDEAEYAAPAANKAGYESGGAIYGKVNFNQGPWTASLSLLQSKPQNDSTLLPSTTDAMRAGVAYTFPFKLKIGVVVDQTSIKNGVATVNSTSGFEDAKRSVWEVPVSYSWGKHGVYATYTKAGNIASDATNTGATQYNLAYDYALTKRAFVGVAYTQIKNEANGGYKQFLGATTFGGTQPGKGETWSQIGLNINYWF